jgi:hypothetical protein
MPYSLACAVKPALLVANNLMNPKTNNGTLDFKATKITIMSSVVVRIII